MKKFLSQIGLIMAIYGVGTGLEVLAIPNVNATPVSVQAGEVMVCPTNRGDVFRVEYLDLTRGEIITFYELRDYPLFLSHEYIDELTERCRKNLEGV